MGYTTMGHNFASAFYVQLVAILIAPTVAGTTNIGENFSGIVPSASPPLFWAFWV